MRSPHGERWRALALLAALAALAACSGASVGSIAAVLSRDAGSGALVVREVAEGRAGDLAGLLPGDEVLTVQGEHVGELSADQVRERLRGSPGTPVDLTVARNGRIEWLRVVRTPLGAKGPTRPEPASSSEPKSPGP